jgi:pteridine reductase
MTDPDAHVEKSPQRVALVTGGAVRVGRAIALRLARDGLDVVVTYNRSRDQAMGVVDEIVSLGRRAAALEVDLEDPDAVAMLPARAAEEMSRLDVVVNNASGFHPSPVGGVSVEEWDRLFAVNTRAPFMVTQAALGYLKYENPSVVNILDTSTLRPWPGYLPYIASKAALESLTVGLARALAPKVRVNAVAPGPIIPPDDYTEDQKKRAADATLLKRWGSPEDVAEAVSYLVASSYVTGVVLPVDGGRRVA